MKYYSFSNSIVFGEVLVRHPQITLKIINLFSTKKYVGIRILEKEKSMNLSANYPGVHYDIFLIDEHGKICVLEMQMYKDRFIVRRLRRYQGMLDQTAALSEDRTAGVHDTLILMFTNYDPFGRGRALYHFRIREDEIQDDEIDFGTEWIIVNSCGDRACFSLEQRQLLDYIKEGKISNDFLSGLDSAVKEVNEDPKIREALMTEEEKIEFERQDAAEKARAEAEVKLRQTVERTKAEAEVKLQQTVEKAKAEAQQNLLETVRNVMKGFDCTCERAMDILMVKEPDRSWILERCR